MKIAVPGDLHGNIDALKAGSGRGGSIIDKEKSSEGLAARRDVNLIGRGLSHRLMVFMN